VVLFNERDSFRAARSPGRVMVQHQPSSAAAEGVPDDLRRRAAPDQGLPPPRPPRRRQRRPGGPPARRLPAPPGADALRPGGRPRAAGAIRSRAGHRAKLARCLARRHWSKDWAVLTACAELLLKQEARRPGRWAFVVDQTYVGQQGHKTENTFSRANYRPRPKQSGRKQRRSARRSCHGFVMGLLLSPSGLRIPCCRCYYTRDYCRAQGLPYRTQAELAAALVEQLAVPAGARVVVLGDTAFEAKGIRAACAARGFTWVVPVNPERVLAGPKPRPKVKSLSAGLTAEDFQAVRLVPGRGACAAQQRAARCRVGPQAKARTF